MMGGIHNAVRSANRSSLLCALHRIFTVGGVPAALGLLGWLAITADQLRTDVLILKIQMATAQRSLDAAYSARDVERDFAIRDAALRNLDQRVNRIESHFLAHP